MRLRRGRSFRIVTTGLDPAIRYVVGLLGCLSVAHGGTMLLNPQGFVSGGWVDVRDLAPLWVWGAVLLGFGLVILASLIAPWQVDVLAWVLVGKAIAIGILAYVFARYSITTPGHPALFTVETLAVLAGLQFAVALRVGRL